MAANRKRKTGRQAVRDHDVGAVPAWVWTLLGMAMGVALTVFLMSTGSFQSAPDQSVPQPRTDRDDDELAELAPPPTEETDFDFYTVLPEMEVVIPDQEIEQRVQRREVERQGQGPYLLQVGSFRSPQDAERAKAELAFLGVVAQVTTVDVNQTTWHRVRVGPINSVREMDTVKRQLQEAEYQVLVLSERG